MNILYLVDPNSIHDQKWISKFTNHKDNKCYFICREHHFNEKYIKDFQIDFKIEFLGVVDYFSFKKVLRSIQQVSKIRKLIKANNIELFHIQYAEPNALWALFRKHFGIPIVITCRGTDVLKTIPGHFAKKDVFNRLISCAYKKAFLMADWITVTSSNQNKSVELFSGRRSQISIIRTGVDLEKLNTDTSTFSSKEVSKHFILFPRYIKPIYNHEFAIEAIKSLPAEIKKKYQMVFVGKESGDLNYQKDLISRLNEEPQINYIFLPKQKQESIWELYKRAQLIIMTPKSDGSPVSGMEAIALNKKLIIGPLQYDNDIFDEPNVFKLEKWSTEELSCLIEKVLSEEGTTIKPTATYFSKIDRDENMNTVKNIYKDLVVGT